MTETAGPQGGPPPSAGRGPWSEAFEGERGGEGGSGGKEGGGVNTAVSSSDTRRPEVEFKCKHLMENILSFKVKTTVMSLNVGKQRGKPLRAAVY